MKDVIALVARVSALTQSNFPSRKFAFPDLPLQNPVALLCVRFWNQAFHNRTEVRRRRLKPERMHTERNLTHGGQKSLHAQLVIHFYNVAAGMSLQWVTQMHT